MAVIDTTFAVVKRKRKKKKIRLVRDSNPMTSAMPAIPAYHAVRLWPQWSGPRLFHPKCPADFLEESRFEVAALVRVYVPWHSIPWDKHFR